MARSHKSPRKKRTRRRRHAAGAATKSLRARVRRVWHALRATPPGAQIALALWATANVIYQVTRKPAELFFPVSGVLFKTPIETWQQYESIFRDHATATITPDFLAALAQIEGSGNPLAHTDWHWYATWDLFEIYRPASSAVGMYQITNGNFAEARGYCIHNHTVVADGPWYHWRSCWFNRFYARVVPSHAAEMTAALLDHSIGAILARRDITDASLQQRQDLAAVIHLCGAGAGDTFAARGFRLNPGQRCGDHDPRTYLGRINAMKRVFARWQ